MNPIDRKIEKYCRDHTSDLDKELENLERSTAIYSTTPQMLSGKLIGVFLNLLLSENKPQNVLEIGSFTGYSTLSMAANNNNVNITSIEVDSERYEKLKQLKSSNPNLENVTFINEEAIDWLKKSKQIYSLVFIDASKKQYLTYLKLILPKLNSGSIIISDNMLWYTKVLDKNKSPDTNIIDIYNSLIKIEPRLVNVLLPVGDGIMVSRVR